MQNVTYFQFYGRCRAYTRWPGTGNANRAYDQSGSPLAAVSNPRWPLVCHQVDSIRLQIQHILSDSPSKQHRRQTLTLWSHCYAHLFNGPFSRTTQVSQYQKGKTNLDFTEARDTEWQSHQLGICKSAPHFRQITMPAPHHSVFYRPDALPATQPTASEHWRPWLPCYSMRKIILEKKHRKLLKATEMIGCHGDLQAIGSVPGSQIARVQHHCCIVNQNIQFPLLLHELLHEVSHRCQWCQIYLQLQNHTVQAPSHASSSDSKLIMVIMTVICFHSGAKTPRNIISAYFKA